MTQPCPLDHSSHREFFDYYAEASQSADTIRRIESIRNCITRVHPVEDTVRRPLDVADIGCGAGTQSIIWARAGHAVHGLDINAPLVELAKERARIAGYELDFRIGSAVNIPWADGSMDVCIALELLEHVDDWNTCLMECARILRRGGILFLTTSNKLCPVQDEFNLPFYTWYPGPLKRHVERLAVTTKPWLANYAKYPAVNWLSFFEIRKALPRDSFRCLDRFDVMDLPNKSLVVRVAVNVIRKMHPVRFLAHMLTKSTIFVAIKL